MRARSVFRYFGLAVGTVRRVIDVLVKEENKKLTDVEVRADGVADPSKPRAGVEAEVDGNGKAASLRERARIGPC